jgi:hypothetical protein
LNEPQRQFKKGPVIATCPSQCASLWSDEPLLHEVME